MDITFTGEWDAKRYGRAIDAALRAEGPFRTTFFGWCMTVCGLLWLCSAWMSRGCFKWLDLALLFVVLLPVFSFLMRRLQVRHAMKVLCRMMGGDTIFRCRLTDEGYEVACGSMLQKVPWKNLAESFKFLDKDTVALLQLKSLPVLVLQDLERHGIDAMELKSVLLRAGVREHRRTRGQTAWMIGSGIIGVAFALVLALSVFAQLLVPMSVGELEVRNEGAVTVDSVRVSFGREVLEFAKIPAQGMCAQEFCVRGDCTCRAVASLADGSVISNAYGYFCRGMDIGRVEVVVTADRRIKIIDKINNEDWLRAMRIPTVHLHAPNTMGDFLDFMLKASKDYDSQGLPEAMRGCSIHASSQVRARVFPVREESALQPIVSDDVSNMTLLEALETACRLTDCDYRIVGRWIEIAARTVE